ncbi:MAG: hypothetical protein JWO03_1329 [Bacteroidetes bacterium]|nr:hypothetical protein [Bacteroidota bacterium]
MTEIEKSCVKLIVSAEVGSILQYLSIGAFQAKGIELIMEEFVKGKNNYPDWLPQYRMINLEFDKAFTELYNRNVEDEDLTLFFQSFSELLEKYIALADIDSEPTIRPFSFFQSTFLAKNDFNFQFTFNIKGNTTDYIEALKKAINLVIDYNHGKNEVLARKISKAYNTKSRRKLFAFSADTKNWYVINPLIGIGNEKFIASKASIEPREKKHTVIVNENNLAQSQAVLPENWRIDSDGFAL